MKKYLKKALIGASASTLLVLMGCSSDGGSSRTYEISVVNATANQPLGPVALIIKNSGNPVWSIGGDASDPLEDLAESGSPAALVEMYDSIALATAAGMNPTGPGATSATYTLSVGSSNNLLLTMASMLVNTNDAFTGVTDWQIGDLAVDEYKTVFTPIYDAGSEANTETLATIPGPAASGEGVSEDDDDGIVTRHPGVVSADDGLTTSVLDASHRFDQGAALLKVKRVQ